MSFFFLSLPLPLFLALPAQVLVVVRYGRVVLAGVLQQQEQQPVLVSAYARCSAADVHAYIVTEYTNLSVCMYVAPWIWRRGAPCCWTRGSRRRRREWSAVGSVAEGQEKSVRPYAYSNYQYAHNSRRTCRLGESTNDGLELVPLSASDRGAICQLSLMVRVWRITTHLATSDSACQR